jgi:competence protein ComEC
VNGLGVVAIVPPSRWRRLLPLGPLAAVVAGVLAGGRGPSGDGVCPLALAAAAATLAVVWRSTPVRTAAALLALAALATGLTLRARHGLDHSPLAPVIATRERDVLTGRLVGDPTRFGRVAVVDLRADGVAAPGAPQWGRAGPRHVLVRASGDEAGRLAVLESGDRVVVRGRLGPLSGFDVRHRTQHVVGALVVDAVLDVRAPRDAPLRWANAVRRLVLAGGSSLPGPERALLAGFLVGDTRDVPDGVVDDFQAAGLSHLLAVSGANLAFVMAALAPLVRRRSLPTRALVGAGVVVLFGTMTRWEPSVLRAAAMAVVTLSATAVGRPVDGVRVLAIAASGLLLADPFLLRSVGFLLSCGASAGILLFGEAIAGRLPGPRLLRETAGVTLAAQLGTAPILVPVFGSVPLVAVPANLVAVPLAAPITVVGLVVGVVGGLVRPVWPGAATALQLPVLGLVRAVELVAGVAARAPLAVDGRALWGLVALGAAARALWHVRPGPAREPRVGSATDQPDRAAAAPPRWGDAGEGGGDGHVDLAAG